MFADLISKNVTSLTLPQIASDKLYRDKLQQINEFEYPQLMGLWFQYLEELPPKSLRT